MTNVLTSHVARYFLPPLSKKKNHSASPFYLHYSLHPSWPARLLAVINIYYAQKKYNENYHEYTNKKILTLGDLVKREILLPFAVELLDGYIRWKGIRSQKNRCWWLDCYCESRMAQFVYCLVSNCTTRIVSIDWTVAKTVCRGSCPLCCSLSFELQWYGKQISEVNGVS